MMSTMSRAGRRIAVAAGVAVAGAAMVTVAVAPADATPKPGCHRTVTAGPTDNAASLAARNGLSVGKLLSLNTGLSAGGGLGTGPICVG